MTLLFRAHVRHSRHILHTCNRVFLRLISTPRQAYSESIKSGILAITLDRPKVKNAISTQLLHEFRNCITAAAKDRSYVTHPSVNLKFYVDRVCFTTRLRVLIVRSSERGSFCAGADLAERRTMSQEQVDAFLADLRAA